ncbi:hypothetical protein [Paraburkholderia dioscoreae]|nr:hypothetical protein [Paraburkholderia dioscoreae]
MRFCYAFPGTSLLRPFEPAFSNDPNAPFFSQLCARACLTTRPKIGAAPRSRARSTSVIMKLSQRATLSILAIAVLTSVATIGVAGLQLRPQRAAADVVIDTAIVSELTGVSDAIRDMPVALRTGVLARHEVQSEQALNESLNAQRANLATAERQRANELASSDRRSASLIALALFNAFATALGAISLFDAYRAKRGHPPS